ncbi:MAG: hypothetical protein LUE27_01130 [Clostridia bacterium]|nr:hypothetical protein [Clostridia bacterium]
MTLIVTVFAAVICTVIWYRNAPKSRMLVSVLCWIYWGASIMWIVDAIFELAEEGSSFFTPEPAKMLNDLYLGLAVIALGLVVWIIVLLIKDPRGVFRKVSKTKTYDAHKQEPSIKEDSSDPADN